MKRMMKFVGVLSVFILLFSMGHVASSSTAIEYELMQSDQQRTFVTEDLTVVAPTSEVPFYFYWETGVNTTQYKISFDSLFEVNDDTDSSFNQTEDQDKIVEGSYVSLPQLDWSMSENYTETTSDGSITHFNLTGSAADGEIFNDPRIGDLVVQFRNHLTTTSDGTSLKFDVVINNYEWKNDSDTTSLVLGYRIQEFSDDSSSDVSVDGNETRMEFGSSYMDSVPEAEAVNGSELAETITASLTSGSSTGGSDDDPRIFLSYSHFDGNLTHDPTIGLSQAQQPVAGERTFETGDLSILVPSNQVPFFFFYNNTEENPPEYEVKFFLMYEVNDSDGDGIYDPDSESMVPNSAVALPQMDWSMSEIENETDSGGNVFASHFNLTGTATVGNAIQPNLEVQFRIHIDQSQSTSFKFDVVINNYDWIQDSEDSILVLGYKLSTTSSDYGGTPDVADNSAQFGDAYFNSSSTAENGTASVATGLSGGTGNSTDEGMIYQSYEHFSGDLVHDPTIGLSSSSGGGSDGSGDGTDDSALPLSTPFLIIALVAIPLLSRRFR